VRQRDTIEIRAVDGVPLEYHPAVAAFCVGLTYHQPSLEAAWELLRERSINEHQSALYEVPSKGLAARHGRDSVLELARELLRLAQEGLRARISADKEKPGVIAYLEPLEEIVHSGVTLAERCIQRWQTELQKSPQRYVEAYRI
jgi:glutamate--cysteine ligase